MNKNDYALPDGLAGEITAYMQENAPSSFGRPYTFRTVCREKLHRIGRTYRAAALHGKTRHAFHEWLTDNYYILEREGKLLTKELQRFGSLPRARNETVPALAGLLTLVFCDRETPLETDSVMQVLRAAQQTRYFDSNELMFLPLGLKFCCLELAHMACEDGTEERGAALIERAVTGFRAIENIEFADIADDLSIVESILQKDPAGVYPGMDRQTKNAYRHRVYVFSHREKQQEETYARALLQNAERAETDAERHVGYALYHGDPISVSGVRRGRAALVLQGVLPLVLAALLGLLCRNFWVTPLLVFPLWDTLKPLIEYVALKNIPPRVLPRMKLGDRLPEDARTVAVVSTLVPKPKQAKELASHLENLYFANRCEGMSFLALADFKEHDSPSDPADASAVAALRTEIRQLNERYGNRFFLVVRRRSYSKTQRRYAGWERKRGAITELVRLIQGEPVELASFEGDRASLEKTAYLIALDSDTELVLDSAREMVAAAVHPLNRPVIGEDGRVVSGYGVIAPRVGVDLKSAVASGFSRVMAGAGGITAYDTVCGDFYMDLFGEGIFAGKGLVDVRAFYTLLNHAFSDGQVLSHDIVEGSFLRTALMSDVELTDAFPSTPTAWFARLHRWIRGDWQNVSFLSRHARGVRGEQGNPVSPLDKYKMFDNLRRSFSPVFALACIVAARFAGRSASIALCAVALLSVFAPAFIGATRTLLDGGLFAFSRDYYSRLAPDALTALLQGAVQFVFLFKQAFTAVDAAFRALWRKYGSGKNLLEWTTAAQSERASGGILALLRQYGLAELAGVLLLLFGRYGYIRLFAVFFCALLPAVPLLSKRSVLRTRELPEAEREKLVSYTAAMYGFYEAYCTPRYHYLPPDNVQESPTRATAARTSPTNIGMMLLSTLAAADFHLIDTRTLVERISNTMDTVEKLEKWHGNLYNWYDIKTLALLSPKYVSAVDSGNFVCCLVALKEGLQEFGRQNEKLVQLVQRIEIVIDRTDLGVFYNRRRGLLSIGYDADGGEMTGSYYDFLMSEARMTSYLAIATRQVPKKHWGCLARTLARDGSFTGPVSWTGTMFEYFMPALLLPSWEGSLGFEALRFSIACQKKRVKEPGVPWGISESGFYAFDQSLNYQYKAHGVQKLGVKRGLDSELVVSPYSSFLALPYDGPAAMKNLARLDALGMTGRYGFYEAVDFTRRRLDDRRMGVVRSYMAHHIGMSMLAADNALNGFVMQKRFMRDKRMRAAECLLEEKIPSGTIVYDSFRGKDIPEKVGRSTLVKEEFETVFPQSPQVTALTNGEWTTVLTSVGAGHSVYRGMDMTRRSADLLRRPLGVYALVRHPGGVLNVTSAPDYTGGVRRSVEFSAKSVTYTAEDGSLTAGMQVCVHPTFAAEQRQIVLKNTSGRRITVEVLLYFEPVIARTADDAAHPAFSKLFVSAAYDRGAGCLVFSRRSRGGEGLPCLCAGLLEDIPFEYEAARERLLSAPDGIASLPRAFDKTFQKGTGTPDTACALRVRLELGAGQQKQIGFVLCAGADRGEAVSAFVTMRKNAGVPVSKAAQSPVLTDSVEGRLAFSVLPVLLYPKRDCKENAKAIAANRLGQAGLWGMGISGDLPVVLLVLHGENDAERIKSYIRLLVKLKYCMLAFDLAVVYSEGGDYGEPVGTLIRDLAEECDAEHLIGARGGVHLVNTRLHGEEAVTLLKAVARHIAPKSMVRINLPVPAYEPARILPVERDEAGQPAQKGLQVYGGRFADGAFIADAAHTGVFSHILANPVFGTLLTDRALGFSWAVNSRENKLTPWYNDTVSDNRGEMLLLRLDDQIYDLANGAAAAFTPGDARYHGKAGPVATRLRVQVAGSGAQKRCTLALRNTSNRTLSIQLAYYTEPVLGVNRDTARYLVSSFADGCLVLENAYNTAVPGASALRADAPDTSFTCDRAGFLCGRWEPGAHAPQPDPCAALLVRETLAPGQEKQIVFTLAWGRDRESAKTMARIVPAEDRPAPNSIQIETGNAALDELVNTWLPWQIVGSRMFGRTGFYQCGGAYGFRDQLQDMCAYLLLDPQLTKQHILRAAAHQFEEGDVLHWWHELPRQGGGLRGVRTRYSDDLLWLVYAVCEYLEKTGDHSLLDVPVRYLQGPALEENEHERYFEPSRSAVKADVYDHCRRAVERSLQTGAHGLPLIGCGDWNDGYNRVGAKGRGESVWLGMFLAIVLERFADVCDRRGEDGDAVRYRRHARQLKADIDAHCWDKSWYIRAFYDDGTKMGSSESDECQIDSLPQSFAVLCGMPDTERVQTAMGSARERLVDWENDIIRLFSPSFADSVKDPGYVKAYPAGIRENGGQYTHASVWFAMAMLALGRADEGYALVNMLNPAHRCLDEKRARRYRLEPYYMAADIYTNPGAYARGGWSMYTGAAGWYYRTVFEWMLGIRLRGDELLIQPTLPNALDGYTARLRFQGTQIALAVRRGPADGLTVDGEPARAVRLDGGSHRVEYTFADGGKPAES